MARIQKSLIGELSGKAGGLVFKTGKNGNYISSLPTPTNKKPTAEQQLQRNKMTVVMDFLRPLQFLIKEVYFPFQQNKSGFHAAKSYYLKEAVVMEHDAYSIHYTKALVSFGDVRGLEGLYMVPDGAAYSISLQWSDNSQQAMASVDDLLLVVCYAPETQDLFYQTKLAKRADGQVSITLDASWQAKMVHLWAGYQSADQLRASPSSYGGTFMF
jgi:hypothetical protein